MKYILALLSGALLIGCTNADAENSAAVEGNVIEASSKLAELEESITNKEAREADLVNRIETLEEEYDYLDTRFDQRNDEFEEMRELVSKRDELLEEIEGLSENNTDVESDDYNEIINLTAGEYVVGEHLDAGRYMAKLETSQKSVLFQVDDLEGKNKVNIVLGDGERSEDSFTFFAENGDRLDIRTTMEFIEVD